jgi:urease accessory protein
VPLTVDRKVMASVMKTHRFEGIRYEFVPGGEIVPYLAPHESRRLFGGAEGPVHTHTQEQYVAVDGETGETYSRPPVSAPARPHAVSHTHSHTHSHDHAHDHVHDDHSHDHAHMGAGPDGPPRTK